MPLSNSTLRKYRNKHKNNFKKYKLTRHNNGSRNLFTEKNRRKKILNNITYSANMRRQLAEYPNNNFKRNMNVMARKTVSLGSKKTHKNRQERVKNRILNNIYENENENENEKNNNIFI